MFDKIIKFYELDFNYFLSRVDPQAKASLLFAKFEDEAEKKAGIEGHIRFIVFKEKTDLLYHVGRIGLSKLYDELCMIPTRAETEDESLMKLLYETEEDPSLKFEWKFIDDYFSPYLNLNDDREKFLESRTGNLAGKFREKIKNRLSK